MPTPNPHPLAAISPVGQLLHQPVGDVPACSLAGPDDLHHLCESRAGWGLARDSGHRSRGGGRAGGQLPETWRLTAPYPAALTLKPAGEGVPRALPQRKRARRGLSPVPALSQSSAPQGLQPGSWAAGSLGVYWEAQSGKKPRWANWRGDWDGEAGRGRDEGDQKRYYRASSSVTSSLVMTTCSGTSWQEENPGLQGAATASHCAPHAWDGPWGCLCSRPLPHLPQSPTSCSVMLMSSSCCRNCSRIYLGAMSTRDWKRPRLKLSHILSPATGAGCCC